MQPRLELKYLIQASDLHALEAWMSLSPFFIRKAYQPRTVFSLYYDTPTSDAYIMSYDADTKLKVRLRCYNAWSWSHKCLEVKRRVNGYVMKSQYEFRGELQSEPWVLKSADYPSLSKPDARALSDFFKPAVAVKYDRTYYQTNIAGLRLTLDKNIQAASLSQIESSSSAWLPMTHDFILEVKCLQEVSHHLTGLFRNFPFRRVSCSKFALALESFAAEPLPVL